MKFYNHLWKFIVSASNTVFLTQEKDDDFPTRVLFSCLNYLQTPSLCLLLFQTFGERIYGERFIFVILFNCTQLWRKEVETMIGKKKLWLDL